MTGCSYGSANGLDFGEVEATQCVKALDNQDWLFSMDSLSNDSRSTLTLESAALVDASGMELVESFVSPSIDNIGLGVRSGWPPHDLAHNPRWTEKTPLKGSTLEPREQNQRMLLLHLRITRIPAEAKGVDVIYKRGNAMGTARTSIAIQAKSACF